MKLFATPLILIALGSSPALAHSHTNADAPRDIVATATAAGSFDILTRAIDAAGLTHTLQEGGPFTVFAPTDQAFEALPDETLNALLQPEGREQLAAILQNHVISGRVDAAHVVARPSLETLTGQRLDVQTRGASVRVANAAVTSTDIACTNGIVHVIDQVLLPASDDLVATAKNAGSFKTLLAACEAAGLVDALRGSDELTVLAPTDEAFAQLSKQTLTALLDKANRDALRAILSYHVIPGRNYADELLEAGRIEPLDGPAHSFRIRNGRLRVEDASFVTNDVEASNGVVQVIDRVLLPPGFSLQNGRLVVGFYSERPSKALAEQLGLDRHGSLLVTRVTKGSNAALYGLERYDVITAMNGAPASEKLLDQVKRELGFGGTIQFTVVRRGETLTIDIPVGVETH